MSFTEKFLKIEDLENLSLKELIETKDNLIKRLTSEKLRRNPKVQANFKNCLAHTLEIINSKKTTP